MYVTNDKYELPIYCEDTAEELAKITGIKPRSIKDMTLKHAGKYARGKYIRVKISEQLDTGYALTLKETIDVVCKLYSSGMRLKDALNIGYDLMEEYEGFLEEGEKEKHIVDLTEEDYRIALSNGISRKHAYNRIYLCNWSKEYAITIPVKKQQRKKETNKKKGKPGRPSKIGKKYVDIANENGIAYQTLYSRLKLGWDIEKACREKPKIFSKK